MNRKVKKRIYFSADNATDASEIVEELRADGYEVISGPVEVYAPRERSDDGSKTKYRVVIEDGKD